MLVYAHKLTPRLQYTCAFVFEQQFGLEYSLISDPDFFEDFNGPKLNYSTSVMRCRYTITPASLLFESAIYEQPIACFEKDGLKAFFRTTGADFPFDLFAAIFYLLSRYEEYLPHKRDLYGRYAHQNSLAFKEGFLQQPLINIWLIRFANSLRKTFPELVIKRSAFSFLPTYDIDIAWSFKNKGFLRDTGGFLLNPSFRRLQVLIGKGKDPYDCYELLNRLHADFTLKPVYFFLVAGSRGRYDKNSSVLSVEMQKLIQSHAAKYTVGIHPSWKSNDDSSLLAVEKNYLENLLPRGSLLTSSRQHYIKFNLPETFSNLLNIGIRNDYSMGYGTVNGFRASVASSFYWYDLIQEKQTVLLLHPFCYMDANSFFRQNQTAKEAYAELLYYYSVCKEVNGRLITIFHNNILGGDANFQEWPEMYERFVSGIAGKQSKD